MRITFIDTETTGLVKNTLQPLPKQPQIIELFAVTFNEKEKEQDHFHSMFAVKGELPEEITKITGIKQADLKDAPWFKDKAEEVAWYLAKADVIVAHNLPFDAFLINCEMRKAGRVFIPTAKMVCLVEQTEYLKGYRQGLGDLHEWLFNERFSDAHRAEADTRAMARCYFELKRRGDI